MRCLSSGVASLYQSSIWAAQSPQLVVHNFLNSGSHTGHWMSRLCTVVPWMHPHKGHFSLPRSHGAPVPCRRTLPHSHVIHVILRDPRSGSQLIQWVPPHFTSFRYSVIHFLAGVGVTPLHMVMLSTVPSGASGKAMMAIFSASRNPDIKALIGDLHWPSLATCSMRPLSASRGAMNPLIPLYREYLYRAPAYAFWVPSSSLRHTVASYELPISKAPSAFLIRTACLSRSPVPLSASDPPPPGLGGPLGRSDHPNSALWNAKWRLPHNLHSQEGGLVQSCQVPLLVRKCLRPLIHRNSKSSGRRLLGFSVPSRAPPSRDLLFRSLSDDLSV